MLEALFLIRLTTLRLAPIITDRGVGLRTHAKRSFQTQLQAWLIYRDKKSPVSNLYRRDFKARMTILCACSRMRRLPQSIII